MARGGFAGTAYRPVGRDCAPIPHCETPLSGRVHAMAITRSRSAHQQTAASMRHPPVRGVVILSEMKNRGIDRNNCRDPAFLSGWQATSVITERSLASVSRRMQNAAKNLQSLNQMQTLRPSADGLRVTAWGRFKASRNVVRARHDRKAPTGAK